LASTPGPGERFVLDVFKKEDRETLTRHLEQCECTGRLLIEDVEVWSRFHIARTWRLLPDDQSAPWVLTHGVARLLVRAGFRGSVVLRMGHGTAGESESQPQLPSGTCLCEVRDKDVVVDLFADRVIVVPSRIADLFRDAQPKTLPSPTRAFAG
jgi:hypothetical protein